ncbi:MAG: colicin D domain-containing protein [Pseudomonadota bacterium]
MNPFTTVRRAAHLAIAAGLIALSAHAHAGMQVIYFHTDATGSPTAAFNADGDVCWREQYSPYGEKLDNPDAVPRTDNGCGLLGTDVGYTGHVQDTTGLVYAQQRYYDPQVGRFLSVDPVLPHAGDSRYFGRYHYGANSPYRYTDPTGENFVSGIFETISQGWDAITGGSFDSEAVADAFADGYNGNGGALGFAGALAEDVATFAGGFVFSGAVRGVSAASRIGRGSSGVGLQSAGAAVNRTINFSTRQIQSKFKHAEEFGVTGPYNKKNAERFKEAIKKHVNDKDTAVIPGTYRGQDVTHFTNPKTGLNVMKTPDDDFISGWRLSSSQLGNVLGRGSL